MILYIVSFKNAEIVESAIQECKKAVFERIIEERFDLEAFMKQKIDKLENIETIIIDESALENADEEIIKAISSFRILYEEKKIIYISERRTTGDKLLTDIFSLGIYNIIAGECDIKYELKYCIETGKTFRDSIIYKDDFIEKQEETGTIIKEKVIIRNEIRTAVNKALIGVAGTQSRIGVTHTVIAVANYLKNKGFKIAAIEYKGNENKAFKTIAEAYDVKEIEKEYFRFKGIDFYLEYDIENIHKVLNKNYNLVIIDFGIFKKDIILEFNRCVMPIIVCGSKPWEVEYLNKIFDIYTEEELKEYYYLFNLTDEANQEIIREGMGVLKKVYFSDIIINPFNIDKEKRMDELFKDYIPEIQTKEQKQNLLNLNIRGMVDKIKCSFLK